MQQQPPQDPFAGLTEEEWDRIIEEVMEAEGFPVMPVRRDDTVASVEEDDEDVNAPVGGNPEISLPEYDPFLPPTVKEDMLQEQVSDLRKQLLEKEATFQEEWKAQKEALEEQINALREKEKRLKRWVKRRNGQIRRIRTTAESAARKNARAHEVFWEANYLLERHEEIDEDLHVERDLRLDP
jgi:23S rRNA maturation mini-RNase III